MIRKSRFRVGVTWNNKAVDPMSVKQKRITEGNGVNLPHISRVRVYTRARCVRANFLQSVYTKGEVRVPTSLHQFTSEPR
jgi:hypothetical protein